MERGPRHNAPTQATLQEIDAAIHKRSGRGGVLDMMPDEADSSSKGKDSTSISHRSPNGDMRGYEYLDHTADVQLHSWDHDLKGALEQMVLSMFGYMTSLESVSIDQDLSQKIGSNIEVEGHDLESLIFNFLNEWLFIFHSTYFLVKEIRISYLDRENFVITSSAKGEKINLSKHTQGTEVKAITYSNMQIKETSQRCDLWVIVDI